MTSERPDPKVADELLNYVAHELRNPLAVVKGFAVTLKDAGPGISAAAAERCVNGILKGVEGLEELIETMLMARSIEGGALPLELHPVELRNLVAETVEDLSIIMSPRRMSLAVNEGPEVEVVADRGRVKQIVTNLIANAVKFGPRGSHVDVEVGKEDGRAFVCVRDEGPGISPDRVEEAFQKYARLDADKAGLGLGLYISRGLARAHGGELSLDPGSDKGCTFRLSLPTAEAGRG